MKRKFLFFFLAIVIISAIIFVIIYFSKKNNTNEDPTNLLPTDTQLLIYIHSFNEKINLIENSIPLKVLQNSLITKTILRDFNSLKSLNYNDEVKKFLNKADLYIAVPHSFPEVSPLYLVSFKDNKSADQFFTQLSKLNDKSFKNKKDAGIITIKNQNFYSRIHNNILLISQSEKQINYNETNHRFSNLFNYIKTNELFSIVCLLDSNVHLWFTDIFSKDIYNFNYLIINIPDTNAEAEYSVIANPKKQTFLHYVINTTAVDIDYNILQYLPTDLSNIYLWSAKDLFTQVIPGFLSNENLKNKWDSLAHIFPMSIQDKLFSSLRDNFCVAHTPDNQELVAIFKVDSKQFNEESLKKWSYYSIKDPIYWGSFKLYPVKWGQLMNFFLSHYFQSPDIFYAYLDKDFLLLANSKELLEKMITTKRLNISNVYNINNKDFFQYIYLPFANEKLNDIIDIKYITSLKTEKPYFISLSNFELLDTNFKFKAKISWDTLGKSKTILQNLLFENEQIDLLEYDSLIAMKDSSWQLDNSLKLVQLIYPPDLYHPFIRLKAEGRINEKGQRTGLWRYYYPNSLLWASISFQNDLPEGNAFLYYNNKENKIKAIAHFTKGKLNGKYQEFYPTGAKKADLFFQNNYRSGPAKYFDKNGSLLIEGNYKNNQKISSWYFYTSLGEQLPIYLSF
jgi:hypothetical protein